MTKPPYHDQGHVAAGPNRILLARLNEAGIENITDLRYRIERDKGRIESTVLSMLCEGRVPARRENGKWSAAALQIADLLAYEPNELFDEPHQWGKRAAAAIAREGMAIMTADETMRREMNADAESPERSLIELEISAAIHQAIASLTPREERVVRLFYGIGINHDHSLEEVAEQFSVTRERIRQILEKALRKLKHQSRSSHLRHLADPIGRKGRRRIQRDVSRSRRTRTAPAASECQKPTTVRWPNLRAYGIELKLYVLPSGTRALIVRNNASVHSNTLPSDAKDARHRCDRIAGALAKCGFERLPSGMWIRRDCLVPHEEMRRHLPLMTISTRTHAAVTFHFTPQ